MGISLEGIVILNRFLEISLFISIRFSFGWVMSAEIEAGYVEFLCYLLFEVLAFPLVSYLFCDILGCFGLDDPAILGFVVAFIYVLISSFYLINLCVLLIWFSLFLIIQSTKPREKITLIYLPPSQFNIDFLVLVIFFIWK